MKIFISWAGQKSLAVAKSLYEWLPHVIQTIEPLMSTADIDMGTRWDVVLADQLKQSQFGLVCLTSDNLESPWINFEAGSLSNALGVSYVVPILLDLRPVDLRGPLAQFQVVRLHKEDVKKLVQTVNQLSVEPPLSNAHLDGAFEMWWPILEKALRRIIEAGADEWRVTPPRHRADEMAEASGSASAASSVEITPQPPSRKSRIFIGHGRSLYWARVQIYLEKELGLTAVNYESESRVGNTITSVIGQLMGQATFGVFIMSSEDETASGGMRARQNVIHEIGLFQAKLGFNKAVLLVEEGLEEPSNLDGIQYVEFNNKKIEQTFYELRRALEREGQLS